MVAVHLRRVVAALQAAGLEIDQIERRQAVQEVVYLLERAGIQLGYRFTWDLFGPFSEALARVLDESNSAMLRNLAPEEPPGLGEAVETLTRLRDRRPAQVESDRDWLRLLACVDFLEHRSGISLRNGSTPAFLRSSFDEGAIDDAHDAVADLPPVDETSAVHVSLSR